MDSNGPDNQGRTPPVPEANLPSIIEEIDKKIKELQDLKISLLAKAGQNPGESPTAWPPPDQTLNMPPPVLQSASIAPVYQTPMLPPNPAQRWSPESAKPSVVSQPLDMSSVIQLTGVALFLAGLAGFVAYIWSSLTPSSRITAVSVLFAVQVIVALNLRKRLFFAAESLATTSAWTALVVVGVFMASINTSWSDGYYGALITCMSVGLVLLSSLRFKSWLVFGHLFTLVGALISIFPGGTAAWLTPLCVALLVPIRLISGYQPRLLAWGFNRRLEYLFVSGTAALVLWFYIYANDPSLVKTLVCSTLLAAAFSLSTRIKTSKIEPLAAYVGILAIWLSTYSWAMGNINNEYVNDYWKFALPPLLIAGSFFLVSKSFLLTAPIISSISKDLLKSPSLIYMAVPVGLLTISSRFLFRPESANFTYLYLTTGGLLSMVFYFKNDLKKFSAVISVSSYYAAATASPGPVKVWVWFFLAALVLMFPAKTLISKNREYLSAAAAITSFIGFWLSIESISNNPLKSLVWFVVGLSFLSIGYFKKNLYILILAFSSWWFSTEIISNYDLFLEARTFALALAALIPAYVATRLGVKVSYQYIPALFLVLVPSSVAAFVGAVSEGWSTTTFSRISFVLVLSIISLTIGSLRSKAALVYPPILALIPIFIYGTTEAVAMVSWWLVAFLAAVCLIVIGARLEYMKNVSKRGLVLFKSLR